jgi:type IV fimbrial biogenesis protein FimT
MKNSGFTLIEMLVAVAVLIVALAVGVPRFSTLIKNNGLTASSNEFVNTLGLARSEAIKRLKTVTVCKSDAANLNQCAASSAAYPAGDWSKGWIAFVDENGNGTVNTGDRIVAAHGQLPSKQRLIASGNADSLQYLSSGKIAATRTLKLCDDRTGNLGNSITISATGRARLTTKVSCP